MSVYSPGHEDLEATIRGANKPIVFLVGSALSTDPTDPEHGVANTAGMLALVRDAVVRRELNASRFDQVVAGKRGADAYQSAMSFLQANAGQDEVNSVIQQAVLRAHRRPDTVTLSDLDSDGAASDWHIPGAIRALAQWIVLQPSDHIGAVLTTNFDPLIELGVETHGAKCLSVVMDADGRIARDIELREGMLKVVHLHGYWRDSDTMHTPSQLTVPRPHLKASLQRLLTRHLVVVAGYGGWDDAFTLALADLLNDDEASVDVKWAFHESDVSVVQARYTCLFKKVESAMSRGRFLSYYGVDCHQLFEALVSHVPPAIGFPEAPHSPLDGWVAIDSRYLCKQEESLSPGELQRYYDGQVPTWRHALDSRIPRRSVVEDTAKKLLAQVKPEDSNSLCLLLGAAGEGKSSALLQIAAEITKRPEAWQILWRPTPDTVLDPVQVAHIPVTSKSVLLVTDDADTIVQELYEVVRLLHTEGRHNFHILACARDTDWHYAQGNRKTWELHVDYQGPVWMRGLTPEDALKVVIAWSDPSVNALGELLELPDDATRAGALQEAARAQGSGGEGSFFGGLLMARYSPAGLLAHVSEMISRLKSRQVSSTGRTLGDAFLYIAACHAVEAPLDRRVLADLMDVPYDRVSTLLERPLGEEAASVRAGFALWTRHPAVAKAAIEVAYRNLGFSLADLYSDIVRQVIRTHDRTDLWPQSYQALVHCARRLVIRLPDSINRVAVQQAAVAAAYSASELLPDDLSMTIDYSTALRQAGDPRLSLQVLQGRWTSVDRAVDGHVYKRKYCAEWGVVYRRLRHPEADVWMQLVSLSDFLNPTEIILDELTFSCVDLIGAIRELNEFRSDPVYTRAADAAEWIKAEVAVAHARDERPASTSSTDETGVESGSDLDDMLYRLYEAGQSAAGLAKTSPIPFISEPVRLGFQLLRTFVDHRR